MPTSGPYHLRTLGDLRLTGPAGELLAGRRKELLLLAYLARRSPRPVSREELAALLWGEREEGKARQSLRHALYQLRQAMGDAVLVTAESASIPADLVDLDAAVLERDYAAGRFAEAADQWKGDFLRGLEDAGDEPYRDWLEGQREGLRRLAGAAFAHAAQGARDSSDIDAELRCAARWTEAFPLDSHAHARLVEARLRNGDFAEARRAFDAYQSRLRHELDEGPPIEFLRLGEELERLERRSAERHPGSAALLTPDLVGRDAILASLLQHWGHVSTASAVVVIEGEDGIGKSRLAAELARRVRAASAGATVLETTGPACDGDAPWSAMASGQTAPALLVVDDVAGAAASSRSRLLAFAQELPRSTMLVLARRPEEWGDLTRAIDLGRIPSAIRIKLTPLSERDVTALLDSMLEITPADRDALAARLATESGGNPFYLLELVYALADAGVLALLPSGRWQLDPALTSRALPVPPNIRAAIRVRLSQLTESASALLDAAVTAGVPVTIEAASAASGLSAGAFESALDELLAHRILRPAADGRGGYEFTHSLIGRVAEERAGARTAATPVLRATTAIRASAVRRTWVLVAMLVIIGLTIGWVRWRDGAARIADGPARVAVLDLALLSPDSSEAWLAAGLSEEISSGLSRFEGIRIKSRGALRSHPVSKATDPIALGRELHVDYLVEGSLQRAGDRLKVGVRLTSTTDGFQVWGRDFDTPVAELPELHDRIAALVAARVGGRLPSGDSAAGRRPITANAQAFEHFLRGTWLLARRTPLTVEQAIDQFRLALALDPTFSVAAARIAYGLTIITEWGWSYRGADPGQVVQEGIALVDRALAADSSSSDAWLARAHLLVIQDPVSMTGAIEAFERAISLDPRSVEAQYQIGQALMAQGRWEEARLAYRKAITLEPERAQTFVSLGSIERKMGFTDLAARLYDSALIVEPGASYARSARAVLRLASGDVPGALDDAQTAVRTTQGYAVPPRSVLSASLALSGDTAGARRELATARAAMRDPEHPSPTDARWLGTALLAVGQTGEILDLLERVRPRGAWLWFYFTASEFDPIRSHPRFVRVMKEARP